MMSHGGSGAARDAEVSREFKERIACTNRNGVRFEVEVFNYAPVQKAGELVEQSAALPDSSAVLVVSDGVFRVVWSNEELRSIVKFGADWGHKGQRSRPDQDKGITLKPLPFV